MTTFRLSNNDSKIKRQPQQQQQQQQKKLSSSFISATTTEEEVDYNNKPRRKRISPEQFCLLTELFQQTDTPSHELRERLAKKLNMTNREVQVWFQNRRAKVNRTKLQEQEEHISNMMNKKVKFNYWSTNGSNNNNNTPPLSNTITTTSTSSSITSSPSLLPHDLIFHPDVTPIDILATAAAYVQRWDENEQRKRKQQEEEIIVEEPKRKSWRPWL